MRKIDEAIASKPDLDNTLNICITQLIEQLRVDAADIYLFDDDQQVYRYAAGYGFRNKVWGDSTLRPGDGLLGKAALEGQIIDLSDLQDYSGTIPRAEMFKSEGFEVYIGTPLVAKEKVNGVLEVYYRTWVNPDREWFDFLETLANQAAIAIDSVDLFNDLQKANIELTLA